MQRNAIQLNRPYCSTLASLMLAVGALLAPPASARAGDGAFVYEPIEDEIFSATFSVDFAALTAHRSLFGNEVNFARLLDLTEDRGVFDMSDDMFGSADYPAEPLLDQGELGTGFVSVDIDPWFFPALASGKVGLDALFTDTGNGLFAIDTITLTIETGRGTTESWYGSPNDGFGIALSDSDDLPKPMPGVLFETGTGFDEEVTSKRIYVIPGPSALTALALLCLRRGRRRRHITAAPRRTAIDKSAPRRLIAFGLLLALTATAAAMGDPIKWTGGGDGKSWSDPANWGGKVPDTNDDVVIPKEYQGEGTIILPKKPVKIELKSLTIQDGANATITGNKDNCYFTIKTIGNLIVGSGNQILGVNGDGKAGQTMILQSEEGDIIIKEGAKVKSGNGGISEDKDAHPGGNLTLLAPKGKVDNKGEAASGDGASTDAAGKGGGDGGSLDVEAEQATSSETGRFLGGMGGNGTGPAGWGGRGGQIDFKGRGKDAKTDLQGFTSPGVGGKGATPEAKGASGNVCINGDKLAFYPGSEMTGHSIYLLADSADGLISCAGAYEGAFVADDTIILDAGPNGVIDLTGIPAGTTFIAGDAIYMHGTIVLDPDVELSDITEPDAVETDESPLPEPDQLHVEGPTPNEVEAGEESECTASVQCEFQGIPGQDVAFENVFGGFTFTSGDSSLDGTVVYDMTGADGCVDMTFQADTPGPALIKVSLPDTVFTAYAFFHIVAPLPKCPADLNGDGAVDVLDLLPVLAAWGPCEGCAEDLNADGEVNVMDLLDVLSAWGSCG